MLHLKGAMLKCTLTCPTNWWRWWRTFWQTGHWKGLPRPMAAKPVAKISCKVKPALKSPRPSAWKAVMVECIPTGKKAKNDSIYQIHTVQPELLNWMYATRTRWLPIVKQKSVCCKFAYDGISLSHRQRTVSIDCTCAVWPANAHLSDQWNDVE